LVSLPEDAYAVKIWEQAMRDVLKETFVNKEEKPTDTE
jgi:hypothetical protein